MKQEVTSDPFQNFYKRMLKIKHLRVFTKEACLNTTKEQRHKLISESIFVGYQAE